MSSVWTPPPKSRRLCPCSSCLRNIFRDQPCLRFLFCPEPALFTHKSPLGGSMSRSDVSENGILFCDDQRVVRCENISVSNLRPKYSSSQHLGLQTEDAVGERAAYRFSPTRQLPFITSFFFIIYSKICIVPS